MKSTNGIGFGGILFVVFLVLKLTAVIDWSWWWITAPLWIPLCLDILVSLAYVLYEVRKAKKRKNDPSGLAKRLQQMQEERERIEKEKKGRKE